MTDPLSSEGILRNFTAPDMVAYAGGGAPTVPWVPPVLSQIDPTVVVVGTAVHGAVISGTGFPANPGDCVVKVVDPTGFGLITPTAITADSLTFDPEPSWTAAATTLWIVVAPSPDTGTGDSNQLAFNVL